MRKINPNLVFLTEHVPDSRIVALQGGTRSGKTYSAVQYLVSLCSNYTGMLISVVRESFPVIKATVLRDFVEILESAGLYQESNHKRGQSWHEYHLNGNVIEFFSTDNEQKVRGRKRDILYANEVNELDVEKWRQLMFRTTGKAIIDFNPSDAESWIREEILTRTDCSTIVTTYRDNPFLSREQVEEIERLKDADPEYYRVFGEGQFGTMSGIILGHYKKITTAEYNRIPAREIVYGLDFGFTAPTALVEVKFYDDRHYVRQILYRRGLTNTELIDTLKKMNLPRGARIYCDNAEPDRIKELKQSGFLYATEADKDIENGLGIMRSYPLFVTDESTDLIREIVRYKWKKEKKTGETIDKPVALDDHAIDAARYAIYTHRRKPGPVKIVGRG